MRFNHHLNFWFNYLVGNYPRKRVVPTTDEIERIEHYCSAKKWHLTSSVAANSVDFNTGSGYRYDWYKIFDKSDTRLCAIKFGDVVDEFDQPTFTKSRPIQLNKNNNILLPLDSIRHLTFINDETSLNSKKNHAVWRGACYQEHRKTFFRQCGNINTCDIADTSRHTEKSILGKPKSYLSVKEQLQFKLIFAIEGNDVASNLKWIMGSNSIPVMPKPKYETWFCESINKRKTHNNNFLIRLLINPRNKFLSKLHSWTRRLIATSNIQVIRQLDTIARYLISKLSKEAKIEISSDSWFKIYNDLKDEIENVENLLGKKLPNWHLPPSQRNNHTS